MTRDTAALRVLLVEDNAGDARLLRELLRYAGGSGFQIEHVGSLGAALDHLGSHDPEVILLDLGLPDSEGLATFQAIRSVDLDAAVVVVSGLDDERFAYQAVAAGAQDYVVKGRVEGGVLARVIRYAAERKRHERDLLRSQDRFRALVEQGADGITVVDAKGVVQYASPSTEKILGYAPSEVVGTEAMLLIDDEWRVAVAGSIATCMREANTVVHARARLRAKDGTLRMVEATLTNLLASPSVGGVVINYRDVTAQYEAESQVRLLSVAVDQGPASVLMTDSSGRIQYVNRKFREFTGYSSDEAIGKTPRLVNSGRTPPALYERLWSTIRLGGEFRAEVENRRKNGELYWNEIHISPVRDASGVVTNFIGIQTDISARRAMDERLRLSAQRVEELLERYQRITEVTFDGIAIIRDGALVEVNDGFLLMLAAEDDGQIIGQALPDLVTAHCRDDVRNRILGRYEGTYEIELIDGHGATVPAEITTRLHELDGKPVLVAAFRNLTERRSIEQRLFQAQKMEAVGQLAGGVAHDFNNVLAAILMTAELTLQNEFLSAQLRDDIQAIHASARRGADITRQLLTFSRLQISQTHVVDLNTVLGDIEPMLRQLTLHRADIDVIAGARGAVRADPIHLEQIVLNLVVNARDAMADGGRITIETSDVGVAEGEFSGLPAGAYVVLSVRDTGSGIAPEIRSKLFEPFFTTKPAGKGTGLGLSTVQSIVRQLQGQIVVDSELGRGTVFEVFLPRVAPTEPRLATEVPGAGQHGGTETVLVVEDETLVRESMCRILRNQGYRVLEAKNGCDALLVLGRSDAQPDLVITDVLMPEMDGIDMLKALREARPEVPAIVVSGYNDCQLGADGNLGSVTFMPKPFRSPALTAKVRELLDGAGAARPWASLAGRA
jgi:two-component system cell cycle sensor histidine kinase/response regulator CckA